MWRPVVKIRRSTPNCKQILTENPVNLLRYHYRPTSFGFPPHISVVCSCEPTNHLATKDRPNQRGISFHSLLGLVWRTHGNLKAEHLTRVALVLACTVTLRAISCPTKNVLEYRRWSLCAVPGRPGAGRCSATTTPSFWRSDTNFSPTNSPDHAYPPPFVGFNATGPTSVPTYGASAARF